MTSSGDSRRQELAILLIRVMLIACPNFDWEAVEETINNEIKSSSPDNVEVADG